MATGALDLVEVERSIAGGELVVRVAHWREVYK